MKEPTEVEKKYLKYLEEHPGATSVEIVKAWNMKPETVASRLSVMCAAGLIRRSINLEGKGFKYWLGNKIVLLPTKNEEKVVIAQTMARESKPKDPASGAPVAPAPVVSLGDLVDKFVLTLSEEIVRRVRPMVVEKLSASVNAMTKEIVRTVPEQKVQLKRVLVCGVLEKQGRMLEEEFRGVCDVQFVTVDDNISLWKSKAAKAHATFVMGDFVSHKHTEALAAAGVTAVVHHGGFTVLKDKIMEVCI